MKSLKTVAAAIAGIGLLIFLISFLADALAPARWYALVIGLAALSMMTDNRTIRAAFGTAVLATLVFFMTELFSMSSFGRKNFDLTEDERYSLTEGTKAILAELEDPVEINYYITRDVEGTSAGIKRYIPRIDNFLEEITSLAKDENITLNIIDPQANTDEEDAAVLDQISVKSVGNGGRLFFGATISSLDKKKVIPYFNPQTETQLEYEIMSAISSVTTRELPVVGLVTPLNMTTGGQGRKGQEIYNQLKSGRQVVDLGMEITGNLETLYKDNEWGDSPTYLDPERIPIVLVVHPAGITPEAEFALDQYLLRGGNVIAAVDAFSYSARQTAQQPQFPGMPPQGGVPTASTLPKLFAKHGIEYSGSEIFIDPKFAADNPMISIYNKDAMPSEEDITLSSVQNIILFTGGAFKKVEPKGLEVSHLIKSSSQGDFINETQLMSSRDPRKILNLLRPSDKTFDLLVRLRGEFETAFPDGDPSKPKEEEEKKTDDEKPEETAEEKEPETEVLSKATQSGTLYLIADSDFIMDGIAYDQVMEQSADGSIRRASRPISGNGPFILNIVDQANNSTHLVGARARTPVMRPLTKLKELKAAFKEKSGKEIDEAEKIRKENHERLNKILAERMKSGQLYLTAEELKEKAEAEKMIKQKGKDIRELQKESQAEEDSLKSAYFLKSLLIVPGLVILVGLGVFIYRRMSTQAR